MDKYKVIISVCLFVCTINSRFMNPPDRFMNPPDRFASNIVYPAYKFPAQYSLLKISRPTVLIIS